MSRARGVAPFVVLALAVLGVSNGSILVRLAHGPPLAIAAWRMVLASLVVVPLALAFGRRARASLRTELTTVAAGLLIALHFATWISSLSHTTVAQSVVLVNTAPAWVALIGRVLFGVRLPAVGWLAIGACLAGSALIASAADDGHGGSLYGNALALAGAVALAGYLLAASAAQRELDFLGFVARSYLTAAVALCLTVIVTGTPAFGFESTTWFAIGGLALASQLIGHGGTNWSLRHLPPAFVALALLAEPLIASFLAWRLFGEAVGTRVWLGGALVLAGILLSTRMLRPAR